VSSKRSLFVGIYFPKSTDFQKSLSIKWPFSFSDANRHNCLVLSLPLKSHFFPAAWEYLGGGGKRRENLQTSKQKLYFTTLTSEYIHVSIDITISVYRCVYICVYISYIYVFNALLFVSVKPVLLCKDPV